MHHKMMRCLVVKEQLGRRLSYVVKNLQVNASMTRKIKGDQRTLELLLYQYRSNAVPFQMHLNTSRSQLTCQSSDHRHFALCRMLLLRNHNHHIHTQYHSTKLPARKRLISPVFRHTLNYRKYIQLQSCHHEYHFPAQ